MMLLAFAAAAALAPWSPQTVEYRGPGFYCGGGYRISLAPGDRALVLPQGLAPQATRLVVNGHEVNVHTGEPPQPGTVVLHYPGGALTQVNDGNGVAYVVSNETPYGLRLTSDAFRGFKLDRWFFGKASFAEGSDTQVNCLAGHSY